MQRWLEGVWYGGRGGGLVLLPLAWLFGAVSAARRLLYRRGWLRALPSGRPVAVVGNLTVGGVGKTPLVAWLAGALVAHGIRVGIVSRGYGGRVRGPLRVAPDADPALVGDEPALLARRLGVPVAVGRDRVAAARLISAGVDLILADDGLQHYRLARDVEIVVIDGQRRFGNGRLLPAGPLREPPARAARADFVIVNGGPVAAGEIAMSVVAGDVVALVGGERRPLAAWRGQRVHAVAGIGNPGRFFATLRAAGVVPIEHPFPDHARLTAADLAFGDALPVVMTEKDAVKCAGFADARLHALEVCAEIAPADAERLLARLVAVAGGA